VVFLTIIDADGQILGRLGSTVAKRLLSGEEINIINAEKVVISGNRDTTLLKYRTMREKGSKEKGPYYPKRADMILKRAIRGMLPYKKMKGRLALAKLRVYIGAPREFVNIKTETIEAASKSRLSTAKLIELEDISERLGAKKIR
jgi:large subunit ribosomal protein L13